MSIIQYQRQRYYQKKPKYSVATLFKIGNNVYIGGNQPSKLLFAINTSETISAGMIVNHKNKTAAYIQTVVNLIRNYYSNKYATFTSSIGFEKEDYIGNGMWESNAESPQRTTIVDSHRYYNPVSLVETVLYDKNSYPLSLPKVEAYADTWTPENPQSRFTFTRNLSEVVYSKFQPPANELNWFQVGDIKPNTTCEISFAFWRHVPGGSYRGVQGNGGVVEQYRDNTLPNGLGLGYRCTIDAETGEILSISETGYYSSKLRDPNIIKVRATVLMTDETGDQGLDTEYILYYYFYYYTDSNVINGYLQVPSLPSIVIGIHNGESLYNSPRYDVSAPWKFYGNICRTDPYSSSSNTTGGTISTNSSVEKEKYLEEYSGSFLSSYFPTGYILQSFKAQKSILIDKISNQITEEITELENILTLNIDDNSTILNNSDFLVVSSWNETSPINKKTTSFFIETIYEVKDFDSSILVGLPILLNIKVEEVMSLIKGSITSASYDSPILKLNISVTSIQSNITTTFKDRLISDNGSYYAYHLRNFRSVPFITKFILKAIPLNPIISTFLKKPFNQEINNAASRNWQTDTMINNKIYSVVFTLQRTVMVDKWEIKENGDVNYLKTTKMKYYPLSNKDAEVLSHSVYI